MPILTHRDNTDRYVLKREREEKEKTVLLLRPMTVKDFVDVEAAVAASGDATNMKQLQVEIVRNQIAGWENEKEAWSPDLVDQMLAGDVIEIAERISEISHLNATTAKN